MSFGNITLADNALIYPSKITPPETDIDAIAMEYRVRGDGIIFTNFNGSLWGYGGDGYDEDGLLSNFGMSYPAKDPTIEQDYTYILDGGKIKQIFNNFTAYGFYTHLANGGGIDLGGVLIKIGNLITDTFFYPTVYRSVDGETFTDRAGNPAIDVSGQGDLTDLGNSLLFNWSGWDDETIKFEFPVICQTLFDSRGRAISTSSYFEKLINIHGKPLYQNTRPIANNETLYCYIYGQHASLDADTGVLLARAKVYENGAWLNTGTDPIMDSDDWEFWNGYFWDEDLQNSKSITYEASHQWDVDVQYSPHHNKFIMTRDIVDSIYTHDGWDDNTNFKVSISESTSPFGPFTNEKTLFEYQYDANHQRPSSIHIVGIEKDKIIVTPSFQMPGPDGDYDTSEAGYQTAFGSIPYA